MLIYVNYKVSGLKIHKVILRSLFGHKGQSQGQTWGYPSTLTFSYDRARFADFEKHWMSSVVPKLRFWHQFSQKNEVKL